MSKCLKTSAHGRILLYSLKMDGSFWSFLKPQEIFLFSHILKVDVFSQQYDDFLPLVFGRITTLSIQE